MSQGESICGHFLFTASVEECETGLLKDDIHCRRAIDFTGFEMGIGCGLHGGTVIARTDEYHENPTHTVITRFVPPIAMRVRRSRRDFCRRVISVGLLL